MRSVLGRAVVAAALCGVARAETREGVVPAGAQTVLRVQAEGVQIYECAAGDVGMAWRFREPLATLMVGGKTVGRHYAGPWWALDDGSSVRGRVVESAAGERAGDIPWLRLAVAGRSGDGALSGVTGVARVETRGGVVTGACGTVEAPALRLAELRVADLAGALGARLLALNNAHAVELSWLEADGLARLVAGAFCAGRVGDGAMLVSFDQDADYGSPNFRWFRERFERFVYVDRVVVSAGLRARGVARGHCMGR